MIPCVLFPFFFYKWFVQKNFSNLLNLFALGFATLVQSLIFIYIKINNLELGGINLRYDVTFEKITSYFYNVVVKTFLGRDLSQATFHNFFDLSHLPLIIFLLTVLST